VRTLLALDLDVLGFHVQTVVHRTDLHSVVPIRVLRDEPFVHLGVRGRPLQAVHLLDLLTFPAVNIELLALHLGVHLSFLLFTTFQSQHFFILHLEHTGLVLEMLRLLLLQQVLRLLLIGLLLVFLLHVEVLLVFQSVGGLDDPLLFIGRGDRTDFLQSQQAIHCLEVVVDVALGHRDLLLLFPKIIKLLDDSGRLLVFLLRHELHLVHQVELLVLQLVLLASERHGFLLTVVLVQHFLVTVLESARLHEVLVALLFELLLPQSDHRTT
jgi:hypothetical protein